MNPESSKYKEITIRLPSCEKILYILAISAFILIILYLYKSSIVAPTRVKPIYREYTSTFFSDFVSFFYSILVVHSAFKPIWFAFWPVLFYCLGKNFSKRKKMKYYLLILGILFSYIFYAIPNHSIVPLIFVYKPTNLTVEQEFPKFCEQKNLIVFAPPGVYLLNPKMDVYVKFKDVYSGYVGQPLHYVCIGNGTSVYVGSSEWNYDNLTCPHEVENIISTVRYNQILNNPPSLFPMFVFDCKYVVSPHLPTGNDKEWEDVFCFFSGLNLKCFLNFLNPSTGVFLPPEQFLLI